MDKSIVNTTPVFLVFFQCTDEEASGLDDVYASYAAAMERVNEWAEEVVEDAQALEGVKKRLYCVRISDEQESYAVLTEEEIKEAAAHVAKHHFSPSWIDELMIVRRVKPQC